MTLPAFRRAITRWYRSDARDLPWRHACSAYAILVSEIMLQQTQVDRVIPKYKAFLRRFPTLRSVARATLADVLRAWSGLGYNGRARRLWQCARAVVEEQGGRLPRDVGSLMRLPGIGRYTACAIASFAFGERTPAVDVNVRRVLGRAIDGAEIVTDARAWELAELALPPRGPSSSWSQALMDVGALFCRPAPKCAACPVRHVCRTRATGPVVHARTSPKQTHFEGSRRFYRGRIVRALAGAPSLSFLDIGEKVKERFGESDLPWLEDLLAELARDGLVALDSKQRRAHLP